MLVFNWLSFPVAIEMFLYNLCVTSFQYMYAAPPTQFNYWRHVKMIFLFVCLFSISQNVFVLCSAFQFSPHGRGICDARSTGDAGPELAHRVQCCRWAPEVLAPVAQWYHKTELAISTLELKKANTLHSAHFKKKVNRGYVTLLKCFNTY